MSSFTLLGDKLQAHVDWEREYGISCHTKTYTHESFTTDMTKAIGPEEKRQRVGFAKTRGSNATFWGCTCTRTTLQIA